jgi:hypothetical protein
MSKAVRRYGKDGARLDSTHGSTGQGRIDKVDREGAGVAPSVGARHVGHIGQPNTRQVGYSTDGSGRWLETKNDRGLIGNAIETHPPLKPQGQAWHASGGKHGKRSHAGSPGPESSIQTSTKARANV